MLLVLRDTAALLQHGGERELRFRVAGVGGLFEQFGRALEILRELLALQIEQAEVVGRGRMTELGGFGEQAGGLLLVARPGAAFEIEHGEREHGVAVALGGGELVPLRRLGIVAADAEAVGVEFADQRHGGGIVLLGVLGRLGERGEIAAALEIAIGGIDIAVFARRRAAAAVFSSPVAPAPARPSQQPQGPRWCGAPFMTPSPAAA